MRGLVEACRRDRFVTTIGGRRRYLIDIDSTDSGKRAAAERQAINSAVQVTPHISRACVTCLSAQTEFQEMPSDPVARALSDQESLP